MDITEKPPLLIWFLPFPPHISLYLQINKCGWGVNENHELETNKKLKDQSSLMPHHQSSFPSDVDSCITIPKNVLLLCSTGQITVYRPETTWGWVNNNRMFIFLVNYSFNMWLYALQLRFIITGICWAPHRKRCNWHTSKYINENKQIPRICTNLHRGAS